MLLPFRNRLSLTERLFWLMLALMLSLAISGHAQPRTSKHARHTASHRSPRPAHLAPATDDFVRNHGTGLHFGSELAAARSGGLFSALEVGGYHQHRLGEVGSVQIEALYFRQPATATAAAASGLRLPLLLVLNPFDNVSLHVGPQLRWQPTVADAPEGAAGAAVQPLSTELVVGAEARVERFRVGTRYCAPGALLADLPAFGDRFGAAWKGGNLQVYLAMDLGYGRR